MKIGGASESLAGKWQNLWTANSRWEEMVVSYEFEREKLIQTKKQRKMILWYGMNFWYRTVIMINESEKLRRD